MSDQWRKICDNYKEHNELLMEQLKEKDARILDLNNRVEGLEGLAQDFKEGRDATEKENKRLMEWNKQIVKLNQRYKQALEEIVKAESASPYVRRKARQALKGESK